MYDKINYEKPKKHKDSKATDWQARLEESVFSEAKEFSFSKDVKIKKEEAIPFYLS